MIGKFDLAKLCKWNVTVFVFYVFWYKYAFGEIVSVIYLTGAIAVVCMVLDVLYNRSDFFHIFPSGVSVNLIMCIYSVITGIWVAINYSHLIDQVKTYACYTLLCMSMCYVAYYERNTEWIIKILVCVAVVCCVQVAFKGYYKRGYGYIISDSNNPNLFGLVLDLGIFGNIFVYSKKNKTGKIISILEIAMFFYFIVGCGSRKCLIAALLIIAMWMLPLFAKQINNAKTANKIFIMVCIIVLVAAGIYYYRNVYVNTESYNRMTLLGNTENEEGSSAKRELFYKLALEIFVAKPVFGAGYEQFRMYNQYGAYSHSTYAEAIASWGTIGCIIYFLPVLGIAGKLLRRRTDKKNPELYRLLFALWIMEIFLGVGQIWFYTIEHLIAWTLLYLCYNAASEQNQNEIKRCKYVKA